MVGVGDTVKVKYPVLSANSKFQDQAAVVIRRKTGDIYGLIMVEPVRITDGEVEHTHLYEEGRYLERQRDSN